MSTGIGIGVSGNVFQTQAGLASGGGSTLLLDLYGSDVLMGYSFRKLSSTYAGSAVRVRRTSDNAEQDIGFDASGNLDSSALTTFLGGSDGFIAKWYDQSGNSRDGIQTNSTRQIKIATAGTIVTKNSLPTTQGGNRLHVNVSGITTTSQPISTFEVYAHFSAGLAGDQCTFESRVDNTNLVRGDYKRFVSAGFLSLFGGSQINSQSTTNHADTDLHVFTRLYNGASSVLRGDQVAESPIGGGDWVVAGAQMGSNTTIGNPGTSSYDGNLSEIIIYSADKTSDFTGIEDNMKTYYSTP